MASDLVGKANDEFVNENYQKALDLYTEALGLENNRDDILCNRAQVYIKLNKYKEAVEDSSRAILINPNNCKAYLRKGCALFYLKEYIAAKDIFSLGQTQDPEDGNFKTWIEKCKDELHESSAQSEAHITESTPVQVSEATETNSTEVHKLDAADAKGDEILKTPQQESVGSDSKFPTTTAEQPKMPSPAKARYDWYQTQTHVIVTILLKKVKQEDLHVDIQEKQLSVTVKMPTASDYSLELDLAHTVVPAQSITKLLTSKIEIKMKKGEGIQWTKLEGEPDQQAVPVKQIALPEEEDLVHKYPSSSHYTRNWDKLAHDVAEEEKNEQKEGDAALNSLFQKIYADGTDEVKKAMAKSFYESGGTVLSTNWGEVGKEKVDVKPPDGMEFKKWDS